MSGSIYFAYSRGKLADAGFTMVRDNGAKYCKKWIENSKYLIEKEFLNRSARYTII